MIIPYVGAVDNLLFYYSTSSTMLHVYDVYPSESGKISSVGQSLATNINGYLTGMQFNLGKHASDDSGTFQVYVWDVTGLGGLGVADLPNSGGTLVAVSDELDVSGLALPTTNGVFSYTMFQFNQTYFMNASKLYTIEVRCVGNVNLDGTNHYIRFAKVGTSAYSGRHYAHSDGAYTTMNNDDMAIIIYGNDNLAATPTPTPTPSPTPEAMPNWISDIIDAIIPIFTPLLVIFICGALGWRFAGAWGFFAGINLAIVLMYVVASQYMPLWAIIAVVVIDIGLLFGKVGFDRR